LDKQTFEGMKKVFHTLILAFFIMSVTAVSVSAAPSVVDFTADPRSGPEPLDVKFNGTYTGPGTPQWFWKFGDGNTSTEEDPLHKYYSPGKYSVTLTVKSVLSNGYISQTITRGNYITVGSALPPVAAFSADSVSGSAPLTVKFADESTGEPTKWFWNFGDRTFSTQQNPPPHTYTKAGKYTISLMVTNANGGDIETKYGFITVSPPP
jgi:PKD repeat protein